MTDAQFKQLLERVARLEEQVRRVAENPVLPDRPYTPLVPTWVPPQ